MNRLTARNDSDGHYFRECLQKCAGEPERGACDYCKFLDEVCERLGQYEDREEAGKIPQELTDRYVESMGDLYSTSSEDGNRDFYGIERIV